MKIINTVSDSCRLSHLDGAKLRDTLLKLIDYYELDSKLETIDYRESALDSAYKLGNSTGICSTQKVATYDPNTRSLPEDFYNVMDQLTNGLFTGLGMKLPVDKLKKLQPFEIAHDSWSTVYMYYWSCFCLMIICFIIFLILIRRHKADMFDYVSITIRGLVVGAGVAMLGLMASPRRMYDFIASPAILPTCISLLFVILVCDKLTSVWCNHKLKKSGEPFALEHHEEHHIGHAGHEEEDHGHVNMERLSHSGSDVEQLHKTAHWSAHEDVEAGHELHMLHGNMTSPPPPNEKALGAYMPVSSGP